LAEVIGPVKGESVSGRLAVHTVRVTGGVSVGVGSEMAAPVFRRVISLYFSDYTDAGWVLPWEASPYVVASPTPIPTNTPFPTETPVPTETPIGGDVDEPEE
jgi:hypothetical protein